MANPNYYLIYILIIVFTSLNLSIYAYIYNELIFFLLIASIFRCPLYRQFFQKILGFRPSVNRLNDTSFLYKTTPNVSNYIDHNTINNRFIPLTQDLPRLAINLDCWQKCKDDIECSGYVLFFNATVCYGFTKNDKSRRHLTLLMNDSLVQDSSAVYFEKICLNNGKPKYYFCLHLYFNECV